VKTNADVRATWFVMAVLAVGGCKAAGVPAETPATATTGGGTPATTAGSPATVDAPATAEAPATTGAPATKAASAAPAAGMWIGGDVAAWRSAQPVRDVLVLDERRALGLVGSSNVAVIDLGSGAVTEHSLGIARGVRISRLVSAGKRVIAYGVEGKVSVAWSVDPTTLVATELPLVGPVAATSTAGWSAIAVSPDGTKVLTCSSDRWPTLRDATTLAAVTVFTDVTSCKEPRFIDATHARVDVIGSKDPQLLDLKTGKAAPAPTGTPLVVPGPGGRSAAMASGAVTVRAADGKDVATHKTPFTNPVWLGDGSAIVAAMGDRLTVVASASAQAPRKIELPAKVQRLAAIPGTTRLVVQFGAHRLGVLDVATGTVVSASGVHLGAVNKIAALDGAVVSGADRLQVWHDGQLTASSPPAVIEAIDVDPGAPVMFATFDGVFRAQLDTGATESFDADAASAAIDRQGARVVWDRDDRVMMQFGDDLPTTWMRRKTDFFLGDLDVGTGRIAFNDETAFYVVRPDRREVFAFNTFDCESPTYVWLERGRERAATYDGVTVHLYDTAKKKGLGGLELVDDNIEAMTFIPGSTSVAVVGASIYLWDPGKRTVVAWPLPSERAPFEATSIGTDPSGTQLAVGFADGAVLWIALDTLRAQVTPIGPDVATMHPAAAVRCSKPAVTRYDDLVEPEPEDEEEPY
jgi:hypothetical protein